MNKSVHFGCKLAVHRPAALALTAWRRACALLGQNHAGVAQARFGDLTFEVDTGIHWIANKYATRTHEVYLEGIFKKFLTPGGVCLDVGANLGYWTAFAASCVGPKGQVHSFEPVEMYRRNIERLAALNPDFSISPVGYCVGEERRSVTMSAILPSADNFQNLNTNIGSSSIAEGFLSHEPGLVTPVPVEMISLDEYIEGAGIDISRIQLIKIDVEGYELGALRGLTRTLAKAPKRIPILIEVLSDYNRDIPLDGLSVLAFLDQHGYRTLDATTLRPIDRNDMQFEENILAV